jgi:glycosyltransferase involved in cell wall biosynthesis
VFLGRYDWVKAIDVLVAGYQAYRNMVSDPWPLALVEAAAAGLPVICTDACGSAVEVVRPFYNGLVIPKDSPAALAEAFAAVHARVALLAEWGQRSIELARPYATQFWADRWVTAFQRLMADHA